MKLEFLETPVHKSGDFKEEQFGIGDVRVIFEILRSKMYPNPIKSSTQEIMCNARDAHREVGKPEVPIVVKMPTTFDRTFSVRDYGIGIGPERMSNVFIKYGMSTKRESNDQTGGFGLGAKSPWAYSDTFGITTWTPDDESNMVKREYIAYIDESRIGKLSLVSEEASTEARGTMITMACKPGDESRFVDWVKQATEYWEVRPTIKGVDMNWDDIPIAFEGDKWKVLERDSYMGQYSYSRDDKAKAIVDGIPYTLQWSHLKLNGWEGELRRISQSLFNVPLRIEFSVGEIQLTANREEIDYQDNCIDAVQNRLKSIIKEFRKTINAGIADATDLWDANMKWQTIKSNFKDIFDSASWTDADGNDHVLTGNRVPIKKSGCIIWSFARQTHTADNKFKKERWNTDNIRIEPNWKVCINDDTCDRPNRRRLVTLFAEDNESLKGVVVINLPLEAAERAEALKGLREDYYIDLYQPVYLSNIVKAPVSRATKGSGVGSTSAYTQTKAYKFQGDSYRRRDRWEKLYKMDITQGKYVYVTWMRGEAYLDADATENIHVSYLEIISKSLGVDIYGIPKRSVHRVGPQWVTLMDAIKKKYDDMMDVLSVDTMANMAYDGRYLFENNYTYLKWMLIPEYINKLSSDSDLRKYLEASNTAKEAKEIIFKIEQFEIMLKRVGVEVDERKVKPTHDFESMLDKVRSTYVLLKLFSGWSMDSVEKQAIIDYVNMLEVESKKKDGKTGKIPGKQSIMC